MEGTPLDRALAGADVSSPLDALFVNAPLRDYDQRPRVNDFTLPVLGMAYIATFAKAKGYNVGVLDAEALGLGVRQTAKIVNALSPRWVGFNLLAPTYEISAKIAAELDPRIAVMVGGHHAQAMPDEILRDPRFSRIEALVIGEGETRVAELLRDRRTRETLPHVYWLDADGDKKCGVGNRLYIAPLIDRLPFVDRTFLVDDPYLADDGRLEANMVGARGCPYDCGFCGAAVSANPETDIRVRRPDNILAEMYALRQDYGVNAFRFVDDLFLGAHRVIKAMSAAFLAERVGEWAQWDATGRINVLDRVTDDKLDELVASGLREVALGIESGSARMLEFIDKRIDPEQIKSVVARLTDRGISVKGYLILGLPTETREEMALTRRLVYELWDIADKRPGRFRASVFEFRPYPGTPFWDFLIKRGYQAEQMLDYSAVDLTSGGVDEAMRARDEFNFSVNLQFGEPTVGEIRALLIELSRAQHDRLAVPA